MRSRSRLLPIHELAPGFPEWPGERPSGQGQGVMGAPPTFRGDSFAYGPPGGLCALQGSFLQSANDRYPGGLSSGVGVFQDGSSLAPCFSAHSGSMTMTSP